MLFSFTFQMKNACFWSAVAVVAIVLCFDIVKGNENFYASLCSQLSRG